MPGFAPSRLCGQWGWLLTLIGSLIRVSAKYTGAAGTHTAFPERRAVGEERNDRQRLRAAYGDVNSRPDSVSKTATRASKPSIKNPSVIGTVD